MRRSSIIEPRRCTAGGVLAVSLALGLAAPASANSPKLATCDAGVEREPNSSSAWGCYYDYARRSGEWATSEAAARAQLDALDVAPGSASRGYALAALATLVSEHRPEDGVAIYERAVTELERSEDPLALTKTLLNLAHRYRSTGAPERSAAALLDAEAAARRHGDPAWVATVQVERVRHMLRTEADLDLAAELLAAAEPVLFPEGSYQARINWLQAAMSTKRRLGRLDQARSACDRLVALTEARDDPYAESTARYNRLLILLELDRARGGALEPSPELIAELERTIELAGRGVNPYAIAPLRGIQADLAVTLGEFDLAETRARAGIEAAVRTGDERQIAAAKLALLNVFLTDPTPYDAARRAEIDVLVRDSQALAAAGEESTQYGVALVVAQLAWREGPGPEARAASEALLAALERMRGAQSSDSARAELQGAHADAFELYVDQLLRAGELEAGFAVAERFRARVLRESLRSSEARDAREVGFAPLGLDAVQAALGPDEAVLVYQLATAPGWGQREAIGSWVLVVTRDEAEALELPSAIELEPRVAMFAGVAGRRGPVEEGADPAAAALGQRLLGPALARLPEGVESLILVLDGPLHRVPFAALRPSPSEPPLAERYTLAMVPAASLLARWRRAGQTPNKTGGVGRVLALGDPIPGVREDPSFTDLAPLPLSRAEAERAAAGPEDRALLGPDASEARLAALDLDRFALVHFATHALIDELHPQRSAIVLSPQGEGDGLLRAREIVDLPLDGAIVILSACSSAGGQLVEGEGVRGLAHALFEAGAQAVVGSLWPVRDDEAHDLLSAFYDHLDTGLSIGEALARAQGDRARAGAPRVAWAGVVVVGDSALVPFPGGRRGPATTDPSPEPSRGRIVGLISLVAVFGLGLGLVFAARSRPG